MTEPMVTSPISIERCVRPNPVLRSMLRDNPIDVVARLAVAEHYTAERSGPNDVNVLVPGFWSDHDIHFIWDPERERLAVAVVFDGRMVRGRTDEVHRLLTLLNEDLEIGHFDYWAKPQTLVYRHAISLAGGASLRIEQAMAMVAAAMDAAEMGHPTFQYVIWAGNTPEEAMERVKLEMTGQP